MHLAMFEDDLKVSTAHGIDKTETKMPIQTTNRNEMSELHGREEDMFTEADATDKEVQYDRQSSSGNRAGLDVSASELLASKVGKPLVDASSRPMMPKKLSEGVYLDGSSQHALICM